MERDQAIKYALNSMRMEGFEFTQQEKEMWEKISKGELPLEAARKDAENFHRQISERKEDCK